MRIVQSLARWFAHWFAFGCVLLTGCAETRLIAQFTGKAFGTMFQTPRPVPNKLTEPRIAGATLVALWVGHATVLVQIEDKFVLTDPVFTSTVGQVLRRFVEPGIEVANLPPLDAVMISHLHMDHLSLGSLDQIESRTRALLIPKGGAVYVPRSRVRPVELEPWQYWEHDGLRVTAVPVQHSGWRYGLDRNWARGGYTGYLIEYRGTRVYFGGDTGYDAAKFRATARAFPGIDLALLPIAPIEPRARMAPHHIDHRQALDAFQDLGARVLVPIHFDTFVNSLDAFGEAPKRLRAEAERRGLSTQVRILTHGERVRLR